MQRNACKVELTKSGKGPQNAQKSAVETHALMFEIADLI